MAAARNSFFLLSSPSISTARLRLWRYGARLMSATTPLNELSEPLQSAIAHQYRNGSYGKVLELYEGSKHANVKLSSAAFEIILKSKLKMGQKQSVENCSVLDILKEMKAQDMPMSDVHLTALVKSLSEIPNNEELASILTKHCAEITSLSSLSVSSSLWGLFDSLVGTVSPFNNILLAPLTKNPLLEKFTTARDDGLHLTPQEKQMLMEITPPAIAACGALGEKEKMGFLYQSACKLFPETHERSNLDAALMCGKLLLNQNVGIPSAPLPHIGIDLSTCLRLLRLASLSSSSSSPSPSSSYFFTSLARRLFNSSDFQANIGAGTAFGNMLLSHIASSPRKSNPLLTADYLNEMISNSLFEPSLETYRLAIHLCAYYESKEFKSFASTVLQRMLTNNVPPSPDDVTRAFAETDNVKKLLPLWSNHMSACSQDGRLAASSLAPILDTLIPQIKSTVDDRENRKFQLKLLTSFVNHLKLSGVKLETSAYNLFLSAFSHTGLPKQMMSMFKRMVVRGVPRDESTYRHITHGVEVAFQHALSLPRVPTRSKKAAKNVVFRVWRQALKDRAVVKLTPELVRPFLTACGLAGSFPRMIYFYGVITNQLKHKLDLELFNDLVSCVVMTKSYFALQSFVEAGKDLPLDARSYSHLISAFSKKAFNNLPFKLDSLTLPTLLSSAHGDLSKAIDYTKKSWGMYGNTSIPKTTLAELIGLLYVTNHAELPAFLPVLQTKKLWEDLSPLPELDLLPCTSALVRTPRELLPYSSRKEALLTILEQYLKPADS